VKKPLLKVECWDDKVGLDASIGTGDFNLTRLLSSQPGAGSWREYKVELLHKGRAAGTSTYFTSLFDLFFYFLFPDTAAFLLFFFPSLFPPTLSLFLSRLLLQAIFTWISVM